MSVQRLLSIPVLLVALVALPSHAASLTEVQGMLDARNPAALKAAEALTQATPNDAGAWIALARARLTAGKAEDAIDAAQKATELAPKNAQAFLWLGNAYGTHIGEVGMLSKMTMAPKLRNAFEQAVKLDPTLIDAHNALVEYYLQAPSAIGGGVDKARAEAAVIAKYDRVRGYIAQAHIAAYEKNADQAIKAYESAYALKPSDPQLRTTLIVAYQEAKRWADASNAIRKWLGEEPGAGRPRYQMGRLAAVSGQYLAEGEAALRAYLLQPHAKDEPQNKNAYYRLGQILAKAGRKDEARANLLAALKLDPKYKEAKEALSDL